MKGKVEMLYPIFITMSAFLSVTWADGTTMVTEQTTMVTDDGTDGFTAESTVSTVWQETIEEIITTDETTPEVGGTIATKEKVNTKDETSKQIGGHTISCYVCSSNTINEDDECYIKQGGQSDKADCDKSCVITHYQREDSKALINVTRSCDQCINSDGGWECMFTRDVQMCTHCCDTDGCNNHIGNGYTIFMQPNFILTVSATVTGMYLAA